MAERKYKRFEQVDSSEVQGEGSWVRFKRLTWGEMNALLADEHTQNIDFALAMVDAWNWVGDDGQPLDVAHAGDVIVQQEIDWLVAHTIAMREADRKN